MYEDADMFMICVAKNDRRSLENVPKWKQEIQEIEPGKPIALVLTKDDLPYVDGESVTDQMMIDLKN